MSINQIIKERYYSVKKLRRTIDRLKKDGVKKIKLLCIVAAPIGIKTIETNHPDVEIFCATVDRELNENAYIVPGLGDAGDRIYGTKQAI